MESPQDPATFADEPEAPTFWCWDEVVNFAEEETMQLLSFDQGRLGHPQRKPTSCLTNLPGLEWLEGLRAPMNHGQQLQTDLEKRFEQTASWSSWATGLKESIKQAAIQLGVLQGVIDVGCRKSLDLTQWKQHILQGHRPFRRDCRACVLDMAAGPPHRRRSYAGTSAWSLGVDVVLLGNAKDDITGKDVKYAVVGTALVPKFEEETQPPLEKKPREYVEVPDWGEGLEECEYPLESGLDLELEDHKEIPPQDHEGKGLDLGEVGECVLDNGGPLDRDGAIREEIEKCSKPLALKHVTMVELVASRSTPDVLHALTLIVIRMKSLGINVNRLHGDRAKELLSVKTEAWCAKQGLIRTLGGGDDPSNNGRVESEIHQLKRRLRLFLRKAGGGSSNWPTAIRYAAEERMKHQLQTLGIEVTPMLPYWSKVLVKRKRWHDLGVLANPYVDATLLAPSPQMSNGWAVKASDGRVMHVREALLPSPLSEQAEIELQEEDVSAIHVEEAEPKRRIVGKQKPPKEPRIAFPDPEMYGPVAHDLVPPGEDYSPTTVHEEVDLEPPELDLGEKRVLVPRMLEKKGVLDSGILAEKGVLESGIWKKKGFSESGLTLESLEGSETGVTPQGSKTGVTPDGILAGKGVSESRILDGKGVSKFGILDGKGVLESGISDGKGILDSCNLEKNGVLDSRNLDEKGVLESRNLDKKGIFFGLMQLGRKRCLGNGQPRKSTKYHEFGKLGGRKRPEETLRGGGSIWGSKGKPVSKRRRS